MRIHKLIIGYICFLSALVVGFLALLLPPQGIIDNSVLWFVAQLLLFVSSIFGFDYHVFESGKYNKSSKES